MPLLAKATAAIVLPCIVAVASFWPMYFFYTRDGWRETNALGSWITDTGNAHRTRNAARTHVGRLYPGMSDLELGSRVVHSVCASGAPCLDTSQYRLEVLRWPNDVSPIVISFGAQLNMSWFTTFRPGDRYLCHMRNPEWFSCVAGSFRRTEYRFIPDSPYAPIQMWEKDGAARAR